MRIGIVGAGMGGLTWAKYIQDAGHQVEIFEKQDGLGGVWKEYANQHSHVQQLESDYRLPFNKSTKQTNYTVKDEVLSSAEYFAREYGLYDKIRFQTSVTHVNQLPNEKGYQIKLLREDGTKGSRQFDAVVLLTGSLVKTRELNIPGEAKFDGPIGYGVSDDVAPGAYRDKEVVIIGMGAFAIENARTAIEQGASKVTIVARSFNIVIPKYLDYLGTSNPVFKGESMFDEVHNVYNRIGRPELLEKLQDFATYSQKVVPPVSDFYFIAMKHGKLDVLKGEMERLEKGKVLLKNGETLSADVVLKCIGFDREFNGQRLRKLTGNDKVKLCFLNDSNRLGFNCELFHGGFDAKNGVGLKSFTSITEMLCKIFLYYLKNEKKFEQIIPQIPEIPVTQLDGQIVRKILTPLVEKDKQIKRISYHFVLRKAYLCAKYYPEQEFLDQNKQDWDAYDKDLRPSGADAFLYPFPLKKKSLGVRLKDTFTRLMIKLLYLNYRRFV